MNLRKDIVWIIISLLISNEVETQKNYKKLSDSAEMISTHDLQTHLRKL